VAAFAEDRYPRTAAITRASWRFGRLGQWGGRLPCWLRDRLIGLVLLAVGPSGLLRYATFDVGPLPATVPAGASSRDDPLADRGQVSAVTGRAGPKRPTDGSTIQRVNYCLLHIMRHSRPTGCSTGWQCAAPLLPVSFGRGAA
jgi:hypothetical protein